MYHLIEPRLFSSHLRSLHFSSSQIKVIDDNKWEVESDLPVDQQYVVEKAVNPLCMNKCNLKCIECNICIHMFKCTCLNNKIQLNICKHIHACCRIFGKINETPPAEKKMKYTTLESVGFPKKLQSHLLTQGLI